MVDASSAETHKCWLQPATAQRFAEIGISAGELLDACLHAREIRARYTVLDLASDLGVLEPLVREAIEKI